MNEATMNVPHQPNEEQSALWNGPAGDAWVELQAILDRMMKPLEELLVEIVSSGAPRRVLDVGCGTGATTLAMARALGAHGECTGIDISAPMIGAALSRAERERVPAQFIRADAQTYAFGPARYDLIVSRFGVMFFDDPVQAFANLRRAATEDASLRLVVWRGPDENPFMTTSERAAASVLPHMPALQPDEPGRFAFADPRRVRHILEESGWANIDIRPVDVTCSLPGKALAHVTRFGPLGRVLQETDEPTRTRVVKAVRAAFEPYVHGEEVRFTAAVWLVGARGSSASPVPKETTR